MANFFKNLLNIIPKDVFPTLPESEFIAIPARPSTAELAEDLLVDPEALKLETHEPGVFDENGEFVPMYSDDPRDLEQLITPLDAPPEGDTVPESAEAADNPNNPESNDSKD